MLPKIKRESHKHGVSSPSRHRKKIGTNNWRINGKLDKFHADYMWAYFETNGEDDDTELEFGINKEMWRFDSDTNYDRKKK